MEEEVSQQKEPEKKKRSILKLLIPLVILLVCGAGSYVLVSMVIEPKIKSVEEKHKTTEEETKKEELPGPGPEETGILDLGEQIIHLQPEKDTDDIGGIVKVNVTLEWDKREEASAGKGKGGGGGGHGGGGGPASAFEEELEVRKARIKDLIDRVVSTKTYTEVISPDNKEKLRQEIAERINAFLTKGKITQVYFTEFIPQY